MKPDDKLYAAYLQILKEELICAMGCTEPIAVAYAAALARRTLGAVPEAVTVSVSGNILKNVKSVIVPHTGGLRGIPAATAAGIVAGNPDRQLEVLADANTSLLPAIRQYMEEVPIAVRHDEGPYIFSICVSVMAGENTAEVRIVGHHTNVVRIKKNDTVLMEKEPEAPTTDTLTDRSQLSVEGIVAFADCLREEDVADLFERQISCNMAIAAEGLRGNWGANIGKVLLSVYGDDVKIRARAMAAAGSDARMNGCEMPVVINSGSGNQGIAASVPVVVYAQELGVDRPMLYRALAVSNLCAIHMKTGIGTLSAYCGAASAGVAAGAGISYLTGGDLREISHTLVNGVAIVSGLICDGAKASCAAKIATAVDAGILSLYMFRQGNQFRGGEGIVKKGVENTIHNVGKLAHDGMCGTDREIISLMLDDART